MNDYYEDEWYDDDDDYEPEPIEASYDRYLGKAKNGQLYFATVYGVRYEGQDWGMTPDDQWEVNRYSLKALKPWAARRARRLGRSLKPGDEISIYFGEQPEYRKPGKPSAAYFGYRRAVRS